jgi:hypothetical protein
LIVDHSGTSPIQSVKRWIKSGHKGGSWDGNGFILTEAAVGQTPQNLAIGYVEASQLLGATGGTFEGLPTDGSAVLVKSTYYGDTDLNGIVNFDDYARLDAGFNNPTLPRDWFHGDFNYDGVINFDDYSLIDFAFNTQGQPMSTPAPEPLMAASAALLGACHSVMSRGRRRCNR